MGRKPKFRPEITRVKLNPEQAVLACSCWQGTYMRGRAEETSFACVLGSTDRILTKCCNYVSGEIIGS